MDECDKNLLQTYLNSPRIWDAASVFDTVMRLHDRGFIEPVDPNRPGLMQITEQGRAALRKTWYTSDNVEVRVGLRVFTNDCRWGTVVRVADLIEHDGDAWHAVELDGAGGNRIFNRERIAVRDYITGKPDPSDA